MTTVDTYSFTADRPWLNHEWLAEVSMYASYALGGAAGLNLLRLALIATMLLIVARTFALDGIPPSRARMLLAFVAVLTYTRTEHIRPQLYSVVLFAALLLILKKCEHRPKAIYAVPFLMALWVNLHGGWLVGLGTFVLWAGVECLQSAASWRRRSTLMLIVAAAAAATLVNPYGIGMWRFLWSTVGLGRPDIDEWLPMFHARPGVVAMWGVSVAAALFAIGVKRAARPSSAAIVVALAILSFRVSRLDAFFCLAVFVLLAPAFARAKAVGRNLSCALQIPDAAAFRAGAAFCVAAVLCAMILRWHAVRTIDLSTTAWLPEAAAIEYLQAQHARGNMLTYFDWGEYAIWHLAPDVKVSMDGRRETVYSTRQIEGHLRAYGLAPGGLSYVREIDPDYVWLPKQLPLLSKLRADGDWTVAFEGPISTVLAHHRDQLPAVVAASSDRPRVFPGP